MMTHDVEHEDAKLREAGFDPAASPVEALARLDELRAAPGVSAVAIARAIGGGGAAAPARPAAEPPAEPGLSAFFSPVDGDGARVIWLLKQRRGGGIARLWGLLVDGEGLINVALSELSRRELRGERAEMERRAGVAMVEGDARLADYVLCEAFRRTPAEKRAPVGNFLALRTEIVGAPPPTAIVHPIYAEMASALAHEPAADLLKEPDVATWKFPPT